MALSRFMKVRGKAGCLVADPAALDANPRRYAGMRAKSYPDGVPAGVEYADRFEPVDQVCRTDMSLEKACQSGDLILVNECKADGFDAAIKAMAAKPKGDK
jgi:hypothetical protein